MAFQSRFGYEKWLQPYVDEMIPSLAKMAQNIYKSFPLDLA